MISSCRCVYMTNLVAPYWKPIFDRLTARCAQFRVLLSTRMEPNRPWDVDWSGLDVVLQRTITLPGKWRHPQGFIEPILIHLPVDTFQQLRRFRPDVVISNEMGFRTLMAVLYRKTHSQSRLIVWCEMGEASEQGRGRLRNLVRKQLPKYADAFVTLGASGKRFLSGIGARPDQIFCIPFTADVSRFAGNGLERSPQQAFRLLYSGQLVERKGLLPFLNELSRWAAANSHREIEFVFAGDGPLRRNLEHAVVPSNLKLTFLGNVPYPNLPALYADAGIFVLPTFADTWGVVVNEAMASGLPVLGSPYAQAVDELVKDGENGWILRPDRKDEMYAAIERSLNTPMARLNQMRQCARQTALRLTPDYICDLIQDAVLTCA